MVKFTSVHGLYFSSLSSIFLKELSLGQNPWLNCELALDWVSDVVPSAPPSPPKGIFQDTEVHPKGPFPVIKKRMIWFISTVSRYHSANCSCSARHPWQEEAGTLDPSGTNPRVPFYTNIFCSFRLLFKAQEWDSTTGQHLLYHLTPSRPFQFLAWGSKSSGIVGKKGILEKAKKQSWL